MYSIFFKIMIISKLKTEKIRFSKEKYFRKILRSKSRNIIDIGSNCIKLSTSQTILSIFILIYTSRVRVIVFARAFYLIVPKVRHFHSGDRCCDFSVVKNRCRTIAGKIAWFCSHN